MSEVKRRRRRRRRKEGGKRREEADMSGKSMRACFIRAAARRYRERGASELYSPWYAWNLNPKMCTACALGKRGMRWRKAALESWDWKDSRICK